jgi:ATP-dependent protease Clp ATPase subunit
MSESEPTCSFCHKPRSKVAKLIVGDGQIAICDRCVAYCFEILRREGIDMTLHEQPAKNESKTENPG